MLETLRKGCRRLRFSRLLNLYEEVEQLTVLGVDDFAVACNVTAKHFLVERLRLERLVESTRNSLSTEFLSTVFFAVGSDIFLGNPKDHRPYFRPDAGTGAHGTRFVRGIQHEIREIPTVAGGNIFQGFKFYMLDGRARSFYPVARRGDNDFPFSNKTRDDRTDSIVAPVGGSLCLHDRKLHKLFLRFVGGRNHFSLRVHRPYAAFFACPFTFGHLARCAAAIFLRADADMVRLGFCACFCFAQRARCAAAILLRPAAEIVRFV